MSAFSLLVASSRIECRPEGLAGNVDRSGINLASSRSALFSDAKKKLSQNVRARSSGEYKFESSTVSAIEPSASSKCTRRNMLATVGVAALLSLVPRPASALQSQQVVLDLVPVLEMRKDLDRVEEFLEDRKWGDAALLVDDVARSDLLRSALVRSAKHPTFGAAAEGKAIVKELYGSFQTLSSELSMMKNEMNTSTFAEASLVALASAKSSTDTFLGLVSPRVTAKALELIRIEPGIAARYTPLGNLSEIIAASGWS